MDREKIFRHLEQRYTSRRDIISRVPLGVQPEELWREMLDRRRSKSTLLPLYGYKGAPYWYVTTDKMIAASEKIVEAMFENEEEFDPYAEPPVVATLEEVFYTSYVEGSQMTMQAAMEFLTGGQPPRDIEEQLIANNRQAGSYAGANLYRPIDADLLRELVYILTDGMDYGGQDYRDTDALDFTSPEGEQFAFPTARSVPYRVNELTAFLAVPDTHPLIKAASAQAYMMILRPFPEGNERLGRLLSCMVLLRAGYTFFSDVSLSALIARKSYGYYEAITNILREENGGDLTYFMEYFLELLSRAVDERRLRLSRMEEQSRQAEREMARTALVPAASSPRDVPPDSPLSPPDDKERKNGAPRNQADAPEEVTITDLSGFRQVSLTEKTSAAFIPANGEHRTVQGTPEEILTRFAEDQTKVIGQMSALLLKRISAGETSFSAHELSTEMNLQPCQLSKGIVILKEQGVIRVECQEDERNYYKVCVEEKPAARIGTAEMDTASPESVSAKYDPEVYERIEELTQSNSQKDRRIGTLMLDCMDKGEITFNDYAAVGESSKWFTDMHLASNLGLVEKISTRRYKIMRTIKPSPPSLSKKQREFITEVYENFGGEVFSMEMIIATLDYSSSHASTYLHQFTLFRVLDCRKGDVYRYQFLITPEEHPEYFAAAA